MMTYHHHHHHSWCVTDHQSRGFSWHATAVNIGPLSGGDYKYSAYKRTNSGRGIHVNTSTSTTTIRLNFWRTLTVSDNSYMCKCCWLYIFVTFRCIYVTLDKSFRQKLAMGLLAKIFCCSGTYTFFDSHIALTDQLNPRTPL